VKVLGATLTGLFLIGALVAFGKFLVSEGELRLAWEVAGMGWTSAGCFSAFLFSLASRD